MSNIVSIEAIEILDSRGNPTLEVMMEVEGGIYTKAQVPSGASTGEHEACELRDNDKGRYFGKGVLKAKENVNTQLNKLLKGQDVLDQTHIDKMMIEADGTKNKTHFGANAILGISLASARAKAIIEKKPLYASICHQDQYILPTPMMNIINGGAHADNSIDFQEFMIRPKGAKSFSQALRMGSEIFHTLKKVLKEKKQVTAVGDEGGFAPNLGSIEEALELMCTAIEQAGYVLQKEVTLALDCAASEFYDKKEKKYIEKKKKQQGQSFIQRTAHEQSKYLQSLIEKFPIDTIEDGLDENDWEGWVFLTKLLGNKVQLIGDDIFVTNLSFLQKGIDQKVANSILIKLNQIGTLTETLQAIDLAHANHYTTVISHRSGETSDTFIADLAVAKNCGQIKTGSLCRTDRVAKYNRLLEIEHELKSKALYKDSNRF
jgi:enolase